MSIGRRRFIASLSGLPLSGWAFNNGGADRWVSLGVIYGSNSHARFYKNGQEATEGDFLACGAGWTNDEWKFGGK